MGKRFTDTEKWKKVFFRELQSPYKIVWIYLLDDCNYAGVWEVEFDVLKIRTGINTSAEEILKVFGEKIKVFDNGKKWFIRDFIDFQYGKLNEKNRAHLSVSKLLKSYFDKGLTTPLQGYKDKDKDKDKEIDEKNFIKFWGEYDKKINKPKSLSKWISLTDQERELIFKVLSKYIKSTPDKQYRKDPHTYLNNKSWLDEIIDEKNNEQPKIVIDR